MAQRSPKGLMDGFNLFLQNYPEARTEARLLLLGHSTDHSQMMEEHKRKYSEIYISDGNVSFDDVYLMQKRVSVNVILEAKSEISPFLPGKFPHCVAANRVILSLAPYYSETRQLLGDDYPYWAEQNDTVKIASIIEKLYHLWKKNPDNLLLNRKDLEDYLSADYLRKVIEQINKSKLLAQEKLKRKVLFNSGIDFCDLNKYYGDVDKAKKGGIDEFKR